MLWAEPHKVNEAFLRSTGKKVERFGFETEEDDL